MVAVDVVVPLETRVEVVLLPPAVDERDEVTEVEFPVVPPLVGGGASPCEGSVRAPVPQRTLGVTVVSVSVGGTEFPVASAMVKRVVKRGSPVYAGEVNL